MLRVNNNKELHAQISEWKRHNLRIAFVPTMGNLHQGHLSLMKIGREQADKLVSSIFVNPMQFAANEDLDKYPRTLEEDCRALMEHDCDLVYLPTDKELYPQGLEHVTQVEVPDITRRFEGEFRPGHMTGVSTIVLKLFNLVQPDIAVFGKKDYQQWRLIEKMVEDLNLPIDIIGGETVREEDGLAMSSRNQYLQVRERQTSMNIQLQLDWIRQQVADGETDFENLCSQATQALEAEGFDVDYLDICHRKTLEVASIEDPLVVLCAARLGKTRLIDNLEI